MSLLHAYRSAVLEKGFQEFPEQIAVLSEMQKIQDRLTNGDSTTNPAPQKTGFFHRLFAQDETTASTDNHWIPGLYCWGGVGRGKTFLMDLFFAELTTLRKRRRHFHRFMLDIQAALNALGAVQNPVEEVVAQMSEEIDILCLDEFFVSDITHAMLLDRLLRAMQHYGITLVTTSNIPPDDLYKGGLQRERFLPAIDWIKKNLVVFPIAGGEDYRHRHIQISDIFRQPDNETARKATLNDLQHLSEGRGESSDDTAFLAGSRAIPLLWRSHHAIAFDFQELCVGNYSAKDYIAIAQRFPYVALFGVPILDETLENAARRFLWLIDEFYDRRVKLLLTLAAPIDSLYQGEKMRFEYDRLQSRLFEMQGETYWNDAHLNG